MITFNGWKERDKEKERKYYTMYRFNYFNYTTAHFTFYL